MRGEGAAVKIENVAIVGLGALGILYAQHFTDKLGKEKVRVIVNEERKKRYEEQGIYSNGERCDFQYVLESEKGKPADLVLVTVKGTSLEQGIETARNQVGSQTVIVSALNGISSEEILGEAFGAEKIIPCVSQGMDAVREDNQLRYTKMGELRIGIDHSDKQGRLQAVCDFFTDTQFPYTVEKDIRHRLWTKFMMNVGVNQTVMVTQGTYGTVQQEGEARDLMIAAMREVLPIAAAEGIDLTEADLQENLELLNTLSANNMPSMRQDGLAKRPSEVELFSGTVLRKARQHGLPAPTNEYLYKRVSEMEAAY